VSDEAPLSSSNDVALRSPLGAERSSISASLTKKIDDTPRDWFGDLAPFTAAALVAWWTTVRPSGWYPGAAPSSRWAAGVALVGIVVVGVGIVLRRRHFWTTVMLCFIAPSIVAWVLGPEQSTALLEPLELFVGAMAWSAVGILLIRPQAVAIPRGAEGGAGPSIGAGDDAARVLMRTLDDGGEPPPPLVPRHAMPRLGPLPLWIGAIAASMVAYQVLRVSSNVPERAVLARTVAAAATIGLFGVAGDLAEVRYSSRVRPKSRTRGGRALVAFAVLAVMIVVGLLLLPPRP
jgi:hypothetical protein